MKSVQCAELNTNNKNNIHCRIEKNISDVLNEPKFIVKLASKTYEIKKELLKITKEEQTEIKAGYDEIFSKCKTSHGAFVHNPVREKAVEATPEEREAFYEKLYSERGFSIWMGNYRDIMIDEAANETISAFIKKKIRERVKDPIVAEKLIPFDHGFGTRRLPLESGYYEVYNQNNVKLVDLRETPIERIIAKGIKTSDRDYEFDYIIYATGFDAVLGAFNRIDFRGANGATLKDKWADGPRTFLGMQVEGFPNMFTLVGPHNAATFCNRARSSAKNPSGGVSHKSTSTPPAKNTYSFWRLRITLGVMNPHFPPSAEI